METPEDLGKAILKVVASFLLTTFSVWGFIVLYNSEPETCTCRFAQHRVHFGDKYTKVNRKCIDLGSGSVQAGDTVYLDVKWFRNDCD